MVQCTSTQVAEGSLESDEDENKVKISLSITHYDLSRSYSSMNLLF